MYFIEYTEEVLTDLEYFRKSERRQIFDEVDRQLLYEPTVETNYSVSWSREVQPSNSSPPW